jgi:hypothetical protein
MPGGMAPQDVKLLTTQERVFASGTESSRITVALQSAQGSPAAGTSTSSTAQRPPPSGCPACARWRHRPASTSSSRRWCACPAATC